MSVSNRENPNKKEIKKNCIDLWLFDFQWAALGLLEGNQKATESFRNGMLTIDEKGNSTPKANNAMMLLCKLYLINQKQLA